MNEEIPFQIDRRHVALLYREHLQSTTEHINHAVREILREARSAKSIRPASSAEVEIALREALANAVFHGNRSEAQKRVFVRAYGGPDWGLLVSVRDEGSGFDPAEVPDPRSAERLELTHGRGIFLMHQLMDFVLYRKDGREVVLYKKKERTRGGSSGLSRPAGVRR